MERVITSSPTYQKGASKLGLAVIFSLLVIGVTAGLKMAPIYVDHNFVAGVLKSMLETGDADSMSQTAIRNELASSLRVNNIRDFELTDVRTSKSNGNTRITVNYQRKVDLFYNIELLITFDDVFD